MFFVYPITSFNSFFENDLYVILGRLASNLDRDGYPKVYFSQHKTVHILRVFVTQNFQLPLKYQLR